MSTEVLTQALNAGVPVQFGAGTMFLLTAASAAVSISAQSVGNSNKNRKFTNVTAGFKFKADSPSDGFDTLTVLSASNQNISIAVGDDDIDFANAVTVGNVVSVVQAPAGTLIDNPAVAVPNAAQTTVAPVNAVRKSITVSFVSNAAIGAATVFVRARGGANNLQEVQAGLTYKFTATYGIDIRNDSGGALSALICEEE
ncbi:MAG: hypothetical protein ACRD1F_01745 [Terriglobales bacterium]